MVERFTSLLIQDRLGNLGKILGIGLQYQSLTTALRWWRLLLVVAFTSPQIVERVGVPLQVLSAKRGTQSHVMLLVQNLR
jgi:hypothetical protein